MRDPAPISCETAVQRLWDYLDGGLAVPARAEVEAHLAACERCPPHFAFSARTLAALAAARPPAADDAALRERVLATLRGAA
jgi:anti-sigma factor RsiW